MSVPTEPGLELWQTIRTIYRTALKRLNARLEEERITFSQYNVLLALSRNGPMAMSKLGDHMLVAPANVTGLVDRMESKGFVRRTRDLKERRIWIVDITPTGRRIFAGISSRFRRYAAGLSSELTREEMVSTLAALKKVRDRVEERAEL